jgi:hypothetical protein
MCRGPRTLRADTLAFRFTAPASDNSGTCENVVAVPGRGSSVLVYWSAIKGPYYYYSIAFVARGAYSEIRRDGMPPGRYRVALIVKKLSDWPLVSCETVDSISTRP